MATIFISYVAEERPFAGSLARALADDGWDVWWDRKLDGGDDFERLIESQLQTVNCVLVVWSERSLRSHWVKGEARVGLDRGVLVPILKERVRQPIDFRAIHAIDFTDWNGGQKSEAYQSLLRSIQKLAGESKPKGLGIAVQDAASNSATQTAVSRSKSAFLGSIIGIAFGGSFVTLSGKPIDSGAVVVAAFLGVVGALVGAIANGQRTRAVSAFVGAVVLTVTIYVLSSSFPGAAFYGVSIGAILGAAVGRYIKA